MYNDDLLNILEVLRGKGVCKEKCNTCFQQMGRWGFWGKGGNGSNDPLVPSHVKGCMFISQVKTCLV